MLKVVFSCGWLIREKRKKRERDIIIWWWLNFTIKRSNEYNSLYKPKPKPKKKKKIFLFTIFLNPIYYNTWNERINSLSLLLYLKTVSTKTNKHNGLFGVFITTKAKPPPCFAEGAVEEPFTYYTAPSVCVFMGFCSLKVKLKA